MKRFAWIAGSVLGLLVLAVVAVPFLVDGNLLKPELIAQAQRVTGRTVAIDGPVRFALLPVPRLAVEGVRVANVENGRAAQVIEARAADASLAVWPLLALRFEISELTLVEPQLALETDAEGRGNWQFGKRDKTEGRAGADGSAAPPAGAPAAEPPAPRSGARALAVHIDRIRIERGRVTWTDASGRPPLAVERIDLDLRIGGPGGPYAAKGALVANGVPVQIDTRVGPREDSGHTLVLSLLAPSGKLTFDGRLSGIDPEARAAGRLGVQSDDLATFLTALAAAAAQPAPALPAPLQQKFAFDGTVEAGAAGLTGSDLAVTLGADSGQGSLVVALRAPRRVEVNFAVRHLDLDRWTAATPAASPRAAAPAPARGGSAAARLPAALPALPADLAVKLVLTADEVVLNGGTVRKLALDAEAAGGKVALKKLEATLPGEAALRARSDIAGEAGKPTASGEFSLAGPKLREVLAWLHIEPAQVPQGKLGVFSIQGKLAAASEQIQITEATVRVDDTTARGSIAIAPKVPLQITLQLEADSFDADAYFPRRAPGTAAAGGSGGSTGSAGGDAVELRLKTKLARLVWRGERIEGIDADVTWRGQRLTFAESRAAGIAGASLAMRGTVINPFATPNFDLTITLNAGDPARFLKLLGADNALKGRQLGAVSAQGGIAGTPSELTLRDLTVGLLGAKATASGKVSFAGGLKYNFSRFQLNAPDSGKLLAAFGAGERGNLGALTMSGALSGDIDDVSFKGDATVKGIALSGTAALQFGHGTPRITADLRSGDIDIDKLAGVSGGGGGGGGKGGGRFSREPINLAALRAVDGTITLAAASVSLPPWKIEGAQVALTLQNGLLTVSKLTGRTFGGSVSVAGTVDGSKQVPGFTMKLVADNVDMGGVSQALSGGHRFDGTMDANFDVVGGGASVADIVASLNGNGKLAGNLRVNATAREQMLGGVAGIIGNKAGKAAEKILGGAVGGKAREEAMDITTALRVVLERFANRNGPAAATVAIRGGVATTQDLRLDGNNAWALTTATVNLPAWTLDSTTNVFLAEDQAQPCLIIRQRGALNSPSRSVDRGPSQCGKRAEAAPAAGGQQPEQGQPPQQGQGQQPPEPERRPADQLRRQLRKIF